MTAATFGECAPTYTFDARQTDEGYRATVNPPRGKTVTFCVEPRANKFVVCMPPSLGSTRYLSRHTQLHLAVRAANYRARRYLRAFSN